MKYLLVFVLTVILIVSGCAALNRVFSDGEVFEGTGEGYRGPITVRVYMNGGGITEIVVVDSIEDRFVGAEAIEELIDLIVLYNSTDLDAVSGATETSRGFLEAVENAIMKR